MRFTLLQQHHLDGLGVRRGDQTGDVDAGGKFVAVCISAIPLDLMVAWLYVAMHKPCHFPSKDVIDDQ